MLLTHAEERRDASFGLAACPRDASMVINAFRTTPCSPTGKVVYLLPVNN